MISHRTQPRHIPRTVAEAGVALCPRLKKLISLGIPLVLCLVSLSGQSGGHMWWLLVVVWFLSSLSLNTMMFLAMSTSCWATVLSKPLAMASLNMM